MPEKKPTNGVSGKTGLVRLLEISAVVACLALLIVVFKNIDGQKGLRSKGSSTSVASVVSFYPLGEVTETKNITIEFSRNMVEDEAVDVELESAPVSVTPALPARYKWVAPHKLRIMPTEKFRPATEYSVKILPEISPSPQVKLDGELTFTFHTTPLKVLFSRTDFVYERGAQTITRAQWQVEFNLRVSPDELFKNIKIEYEGRDGGPVNFGMSRSTPPSKEFTITTDPVVRKGDGRNMKLTIRKGLVSADGPLGLQHDFTTAMKIETSLKIYALEGRQQGMENAIRIDFSAPVDPAMAKEHIKLKPDITWRVETDGRSVFLKGDFKTDKTYTVSISRGLIGSDATVLEADFSQNVQFGNMDPSVAFKNRGIYLLRSGKRNVAVESVNINKMSIEVEKVFMNNLVHLLYSSSYDYYWWDMPENLGRRVLTETMDLPVMRNTLQTTVIPLDELEGQGRKGIFRVVARSYEDYWRSDSILVLMTDMGIIARRAEDTLMVWINSLDSMDAMSGVSVSLYSSNNQVIATAKTGADGTCRFDGLPELLKEEDFRPYVIVATKNDDVTFLKFDDTEMPVATFDVGGNPTVISGYEAYVYPERDIFRPGEKARLAAIVRGKGITVPGSFPVKIKVTDPRQQSFYESVANTGPQGMISFEMTFPDYSMTGRYKVSLEVANNVIGRAELNVEDFIPDKIKVLMTSDKKSYSTGEKIQLNIEGQTLFGPPAANRAVEAKMVIRRHSFSPKKWSDFSFGLSDKSFDDMEMQGGKSVLDENGLWKTEIKIPENMDPGTALKGVLSATVKEHGGRAVSAYADVDIHPYSYYIGMRRKSEDYAEIGQKYNIECIAVTPTGELKNIDNVSVKVYQYVYHSILRQDRNGYYRYVSEVSREIRDSFTFTPGKGKFISVTPTDYGRYEVVATGPDGRTETAITFYASGWGYSPWAMDNPDRVEMEVERASYKVGEKAKILIKAPFPGKVLLVTEREKVYDFKVFQMRENTATIEVPIKSDYRPNIFVSATIIKSLEDYDGRTPMRAFGVTPVMIDNRDRDLAMKIKAPEVALPGSKLELEVKVNNHSAGALVTIAAVDEGILQLTDFTTPDPMPFFYGKKRLETRAYDIYSYVLPEVAPSAAAPGGDYMEKVRKKHLSPVGIRRVEPVSLWSGIVKTDSRGVAKVSFDVPQFQGRLRIMAVGASDNYFGSARDDVYVRDKITLTPTFPRFISGGDEFFVPVTVYNATGRDADINVSLKIDGAVEAVGGTTKKIFVKNQSEQITGFELVANGSMGKVSFTLEAKGGGAKTFTKTNLPIRPAAPPVTTTRSYSIEPGKSVKFDFSESYIPGTGNLKIVVSSLPSLEFAGGLQYLLKYPHGCIEQTTSKVFPLLYFDDLAKAAAPELFDNNGAGYFVMEGIRKISSMQLSNGSFSYWPGGTHSNDWGSIYASNFLVEARAAGYNVPDEVYNKMISWLTEISAKNYENDYYGLRRQAYVSYVLALANHPAKDLAMYLKENSLGKLGMAGAFQLALSFSKMGDMKTAASLIPTEIHPPAVERETGGNFTSSVRDTAIMLNVIAEIFPESPAIAPLMSDLSRNMKNGRWTSTQDNAFALLAVGKVLQRNNGKKCKGDILVDGRKFAPIETKGVTIENASFLNKKISIASRGDGTCYAFTQAWGIPATGDIDEYGKGIEITREFLDINGKAITNNVFKHGEMVIAKITMTATSANLENVVVDDMLPAGLEIENTRLASKEEIPWLSQKSFTPEYLDIRDDRLLLYTNLIDRNTRVFYYALRAITRGTFTLPPVSAEAMYNPEFSGINSSGIVKILSESEMESEAADPKKAR